MTNANDTPGIYIYNRLTGMLDPTADMEGLTSVSIDELTNGKVTFAGTMIWDTEKNIAIGDLKPTETNTFINYPSGHLEHFVPVPTNEINTRYYTLAGYSVGAEFEVDLPTGVTQHYDLDYSKVAPPGRQLYVRNPDDWREGYRWVDYIPGMSDYVMDTSGDIWTRATQEETIQYMLRGLVFGKYSELLQEMVNSDMQDENGAKLETVSDAAAFVVRMNQSSVQAARFTYISNPE